MFEVVDEKKCHDNGCNLLTLKWLDEMTGDVCRSRLVRREIKRAKNRDEQLGPDDAILTHAAVGRVEDSWIPR